MRDGQRPINNKLPRCLRRGSLFGTGATELDALEALYPGDLAQLVESTLSAYYDRDAARAISTAQRDLENAVRVKVEAITQRYQDTLDELAAELRSIEVNAADFLPEVASATVPERDTWLFDSGRGYVDQIARYKAHKENDKP